jgi:hypothetical protein
MKKYELTDETVYCSGKKLYRIRALIDFADVMAGELGGYVEGEENLEQTGDAWVCGDARVFGYAQVFGNAQVFGDAQVYGYAQVFGDAWVCDNADYIVFKNWWSSGRYFTWTRSNDMWKAGCFYGTGMELIDKAYKDSEMSGREYARVVNYVNSIKADLTEMREKKSENNKYAEK